MTAIRREGASAARRDSGRRQSRAPPQPAAAPTTAPTIKEASPEAALQLLGLLQRGARFVDFVEEDIAGYSDADIGAAARLVHEGCRTTLREHFTIRPVRQEPEGSRVTLADGFDATAIRLTGNVVGKPPFNGTISHRGWRVEDVRLPMLDKDTRRNRDRTGRGGTMTEPRYSIGIDLGTTHCALSYVDLSASDGEKTIQGVLPITQLTAPGAIEAPELLPSFLYLPHPSELTPGDLALPWTTERDFAVGEMARSRGAGTPIRLVSSAKSWLCHPGVDRRAAILPSDAPPEVTRVSPLESSVRYLTHLREAWDHAHPDAPFSEQEVTVTIPASFDPAARELTAEAAQAAGYAHMTLLEEPQAALYSWIQKSDGAWRKEVKVGDIILVVDVGGGTTDLSLIAVIEREGNLELHRVAVGEHILLGGDNMDLRWRTWSRASWLPRERRPIRGSCAHSPMRAGRPRKRC